MTDTENGPHLPNRLSRQRFYRRLLFGFVAGGVAAGLVLRQALGRPLLGEVVYWVGIVGFLAVWRWTPVRLFDERDVTLERRAGQLTLAVFAVVLVVVASAARVLPRVTAYSVPDAVWPALYAYGSLYVVFLGIYIWLRVR